MFTVNILCRDHSQIPHVQAKTRLGCNPHFDGVKPETPQNPKHMLAPITGHFHSAVCLGHDRLNWTQGKVSWISMRQEGDQMSTS